MKLAEKDSISKYKIITPFLRCIFLRGGGFMQNSNIKGIWMPYKILTNEKLSDKEKIIYSIVLFFSKNDGYCTITNKYLASIVDLSTTRVSKLISSLVKKTYVKVETNFQDTNRKIISRKIVPLIKYDNSSCSKTTNPLDDNYNKGSRKDITSFDKNNKYINNKKYKNTNRTYSEDFFNNLYANKC